MLEPTSVALGIMKGLPTSTANPQTEAAVSSLAQGSRVASSMYKVGESQKATAAEKAQFADHLKAKHLTRKKNFPQPKQRSLGGLGSHSTDSYWESSGAQILKPNQGLEGGQNSDPWSLATSAVKLEEALENGNRLHLTA